MIRPDITGRIYFQTLNQIAESFHVMTEYPLSGGILLKNTQGIVRGLKQNFLSVDDAFAHGCSSV